MHGIKGKVRSGEYGCHIAGFAGSRLAASLRANGSSCLLRYLHCPAVSGTMSAPSQHAQCISGNCPEAAPCVSDKAKSLVLPFDVLGVASCHANPKDAIGSTVVIKLFYTVGVELM